MHFPLESFQCKKVLKLNSKVFNLKFVPKLITPQINKRYSKLRTSIMAPPVNGPKAKATHNAISDI